MFDLTPFALTDSVRNDHITFLSRFICDLQLNKLGGLMMKKMGKPTTEKRRAFVMSLRDSGLSYEQIAAEAVKKFGAENLPKGYNKRLVCLDVKRELDSNSSKKLNISLRYRKILDYRLAGLSFQQILQKLKQEFGENNLPQRYSERHVCRDLKRYLKKINTQDKQDLIEAKDLYQQRLNFLLNTLWPKACDGDYGAIDRTLRIIDALSRLGGADNNVATSTASLPEHKKFKSIADITAYYTQADKKGQNNENDES